MRKVVNSRMMDYDKDYYVKEAVDLLMLLIATPSVSREESAAADVLCRWMAARDMDFHREGNNVWTDSGSHCPSAPTILLNAHIDTVKPVPLWRRDPFTPSIEGDRLYGLGSNDCGGGLVTLLQVFRILKSNDTARPYRVIYLATAEEEVSGRNGMERMVSLLPHIDVAIVGEPTSMQPAIAEKGLMVIDGSAEGVSGHAALSEGVNAIYIALDDLLWLRDYHYKKISPLLGPTTMKVTQINAGTQHNVIPAECRFVIDVRSNELYTNEELFRFIDDHTRCRLQARSFRLSSSSIDSAHPLIRRLCERGRQPFGSPTLSDQALMPWSSFKLGPGNSNRSHTADEYILLSEISNAFDIYLSLF